MSKQEYLDELRRVQNNMESIIFLVDEIAETKEEKERAVNVSDELIRISIRRLEGLIAKTETAFGLQEDC